MNTTTKQELQERLRQLCDKESQNKVAKRADVSSATISQVLNGKWELIAAEMWRKIQKNLRIDLGWQTAQTRNLKNITQLLSSAQALSISIGISHDAGAGKSHAFKEYERNYRNVIYIECKNYWHKKNYAQALLRAAGISDGGTTVELIERFIAHIKTLDRPLVIFDQFDKLKDPQLDLFMDFYNECEGHAGFVLSGVPALSKRVRKGVQHDKIGYRELWSRIGRKFIRLDGISMKDVTAVCTANGLMDKDHIRYIYNTCEGDYRRVKREVEKYYLKQAS